MKPISRAGASVQGAVHNVVTGPLTGDYKREENDHAQNHYCWVYLGCEHPCFR
jgi:hypothetical protein